MQQQGNREKMQETSVVLGILADVFVSVFLFLSSLHPIFMSAHIEEALEWILASSVILVHEMLFWSLLRLFDIPKDVIWQLCEDLVVRASRHAAVESAAQIGDKVVFLALLEGIELTG